MFWKLNAPVFKRPKRRSIFKYWNGNTYCNIDPLLVEERLEQHEQFRSDVHPGGAAAGELEAFNICVDAYSKAFDVNIYDGKSGLTRGELFGLMGSFDMYMLSLKKSIKSSQTPAPSMDATSSESSESTTNGTLDSSSIFPGKKCEDPSTCTMESCQASGCTSEEPQ